MFEIDHTEIPARTDAALPAPLQDAVDDFNAAWAAVHGARKVG